MEERFYRDTFLIKFDGGPTFPSPKSKTFNLDHHDEDGSNHGCKHIYYVKMHMCLDELTPKSPS